MDEINQRTQQRRLRALDFQPVRLWLPKRLAQRLETLSARLVEKALSTGKDEKNGDV